MVKKVIAKKNPTVLMAKRDPKTGRYLPRKSTSTSKSKPKSKICTCFRFRFAFTSTCTTSTQEF